MARPITFNLTRWADQDKTVAETYWNNPYTINVDPTNKVEKWAWDCLVGYKIRIAYSALLPKSGSIGWNPLEYNRHFYTEWVNKEKIPDTGSDEPTYHYSIEVPSDARTIQFQIMLDINM